MNRTHNGRVKPGGKKTGMERRALPWPWLIVVGVTLALLSSPATTVVRDPIKKKGAGPLFQIRWGGKWGYIDRKGKVAIPPQFDDEGDFFSGLAKVRKDQKWGYIDEAGRTVIGYQFDNAGDFKEGLAPVLVEHGWTIIDPAGRFVSSSRFQALAEFADGLARFEVWETVQCSSGVYTRDNAPWWAFELHSHPPPSPGGCYPSNALYGYIDKKGDIAIPPRLPVAYDFSEGLAAARADRSGDSRYGYIDHSGRMAIEPRFDEAYQFAEGLAAVEIGSGAQGGKRVSGQWGFINRSGEFQIRKGFEAAHSFSEGLAAVQMGGLWGYINRQGEFAIQPKYSAADAFSEGLALIWPYDEEREHYIDKRGRRALPELKLWPQCPFSDGLTVAGQIGDRMYVDRAGRVVAPYEVRPVRLPATNNPR